MTSSSSNAEDPVRPPISPSDVPQLMKEEFGIEDIAEVLQLNSYDDKNFLVRLLSPIQSGETGTFGLFGDEFVLKILNSQLSEKESLITAQNQLMLYLKKRGFNVSYPLPTKEGGDHRSTRRCLKNSKNTFNIRLFPFLKGTILHKIPYTANVLYETGELLSRLSLALKDYETLNAGNDLPIVPFKSSEFSWYLREVPKIVDAMPSFQQLLETKNLEVEQIRELVDTIANVVEEFKTRVMSEMDNLEQGIIHGDYNEQNILVVEGSTESQYTVNGLIDFGDSHYSCRLFDYAIGIAYMTIECGTMEQLEAGGHFLAGYLCNREIPLLEWRLLPTAVAGRLSQSLVLDELERLDKLKEAFFRQAPKMAPEQRNREWGDLHSQYEKIIQEETAEKLNIADQCYQLTDRFLRKLDEEIEKFKCELEADSPGIAERLEQSGRDAQGNLVFTVDVQNRSSNPLLAAAQQQAIAETHAQQSSRRHRGAPHQGSSGRLSEVLASLDRLQYGYRMGTGRTESDAGSTSSGGGGIPPPSSRASSPPSSGLARGVGLGIGDVLGDPYESSEYGSGIDGEIDPNEQRYCLCGQVSYGDMIACDTAGGCPNGEWFHYGCVDITSTPKGKWYCPTCIADSKRRRRH
ncbi:unnamed protein product [Cyprideis torosa]|uniref:Inhibitor of growth protein n=1 Tax=Cyprideis torosa TaxID=163714 RepID=A0A7R8ZRN9_9CRUS|nr:unnamed protein product [Cyprideis torosa]CAG0893626.1 unnamed protein product [Cyprideis torosa]